LTGKQTIIGIIICLICTIDSLLITHLECQR